jgi:hypothetical protein
MAIYSYPSPMAPQYEKPTSVEDCLPQARVLAKKEHGRAAIGPVKKGDKILIVTFPDQDEYVKLSVTQALEEEGAEKVDFIDIAQLLNVTQIDTFSVEDGWKEVEMLEQETASGAMDRKEALTGLDLSEPLRAYLDKHHEYTGLLWDIGGRPQRVRMLEQHGHKFKNNWLFNNWEEFLSKAWIYPDELWIEIERKIIEPLGEASEVRITDPEGTHLEYTLTAEQAKRWQMTAWHPGHLLMDPLQSTTQECSKVPVSHKTPPVFPNYNGVLAGTSNHRGFFPRIELIFEKGRLEKVKGGGRYGEGITARMDRYKDVHWPGYPEKGYFWFCDAALCTGVKAFRRTSDMLNSYWGYANETERNRAGVFHMGIGARWHGEEYKSYTKENNLPTGHIHVHNYFVTFEIKLRGTSCWQKLVDKGWLTGMDDPQLRSLATKYGNPDELLSYDWIPPLPGINCEGNYFRDYAPNPLAYLKKRMKQSKAI